MTVISLSYYRHFTLLQETKASFDAFFVRISVSRVTRRLSQAAVADYHVSRHRVP